MSASTDVVIVSATRTPVGSFNGAFATTPAHELGAIVMKAALDKAGVSGDDVDEVVFGQVLTAGMGQNPARQAAIGAGISEGATAWGLNQVCGSGLRSVAIAAQQIMCGDATIMMAGGQENMTLSPHCAPMRAGYKMGDYKMVDTMIKDGLWDAFNGYHMGQTAENVA
ncbi:MAG: acetyl-CoA C-acetyltransferase, partial [Roseibium sp.]